MNENEISFYIRKSIFSVYNELGPGLLEKVYEKVLAFELQNNGLNTYLKLTNLKLRILVNFNTNYIDKSIIRKINGNIR
ncbi:GxxExxY protein [Chryseobacterium sp. NRRL B-14859]|uniref:GxxExxY protein n=1 Tax=Chryseobacterium sp. NRRL B-14859 TaxID=1562763 RepID=UPI003395CC98